MKYRTLGSRRLLCATICVTLFSVGVTSIFAQLQTRKSDGYIAKQVVQYLEQSHLKAQRINDDVSVRFFEKFLKEFDPAKLYFEQRDIDEFRGKRTLLDDQIKSGDISFARVVLRRFQQRSAERLPLIKELLKLDYDFAKDEELSVDYDKRTYMADGDQIKQRWRKRIKRDLLLQRVSDDEITDKEHKDKVQRRYTRLVRSWNELDSDELLEIYISALTSSYDPHTTYMSGSTLDDFNIIMSLQLEGIGARLRSEDGFTVIDEIIAGGAADRHGKLEVGDYIIAVDPDGDRETTKDDLVDVIDMKLKKVVTFIRGKRNTRVLLKVLKGGKGTPVDYAMTRDKVELKESEAKSRIIKFGKKNDGKDYRIGYIELPSFYMDIMAASGGASRDSIKRCSVDVRRILNKFNREGGTDGIILDLRSNGGGALREAIDLTGLFIEEGPVVQVKDDNRIQYHTDSDPAIVYDGPLMVLVSKLSASASEILAGAIQDYRRGIIVGDNTTHGKGTVQTMEVLGSILQRRTGELGALKLTIQKFYRVNGDSTQERGVNSDVVLPSLISKMEIGEGDLDNHLPFDSLESLPHTRLAWVNPSIVRQLQEKSDVRRGDSDDFKKLDGEIKKLVDALKRKVVSLNEAKLRAEIAGREETSSGSPAEELVNPKNGNAEKEEEKEKEFPRSFYDEEVLSIMVDYLKIITESGLTAAR